VNSLVGVNVSVSVRISASAIKFVSGAEAVAGDSTEVGSHCGLAGCSVGSELNRTTISPGN